MQHGLKPKVAAMLFTLPRSLSSEADEEDDLLRFLSFLRDASLRDGLLLSLFEEPMVDAKRMAGEEGQAGTRRTASVTGLNIKGHIATHKAYLL